MSKFLPSQVPRVQRLLQPSDDGAPDLGVPVAAVARQEGGHAALELQGTELWDKRTLNDI